MTSGDRGRASTGAASTPTARRRRLRDPATALIAAAIVLPVVFFALAAWQGYARTLREAENRAERTARILEEHALKVFETHRLVIQQVNSRMRFVDWSRPADRADLHGLLLQLQDDLDQVATVTVTDADGRMRASGRTFPADPKVSFADRDYFQALKAADPKLPYVSRAYAGRQSGLAVFNVAERVRPGPGRVGSGDAFLGVIAVSVDRAYFERFYQTVEPTFDHSVLLVRADGQILAHVPFSPRTTLPEKSALLSWVAKAPKGSYRRVSAIDGVERIFAYRKVGDYPVYVRFGISLNAALAPWRLSLFAYGLVALLASLALVGVSVLALRQTGRERLARRRWEETAAALRLEAAERSRVEDQLRQSQKMEAVGRLTGGVAHDFNNLLTAVIGSLDLVRRRKDRVDPQILELVTNAMEGANRAAALTSRLLAFSRQQPLETTRVDVNALVAGMSELIRRTLGEGITVITMLADGLWPTASDSNQLESAILNLAVNARDAMPDGGVLTIETANGHDLAGSVEGRYDLLRGDYVTVSVSDTGSGMSAEVLANIFEPFFTTKPVGHGTGLGLSQVYGFVRQSGGHVAVESEVGQGTRFKIFLPRLAGDAVAARQPVAAARPVPIRRGGGETILVVEDEPMVLRLSVAALEDAGYRVVPAASGQAALDLFRREPSIALLFTDVVLGGAMNGRVLADAILRERPGLPVLFTSGYTGDIVVDRGAPDHDVTLLAKPFSTEVLVARVGEMIAARARSTRRVAAL